VELSELDYDLPAELIAQAPAPSRDASRLLVIDRARSGFEDHGVAELPELLRAGDCLVVNNSRVIPARVLTRDAEGRDVELLFVEPVDGRRWRALSRPGRRSRVGVELSVGDTPGARLRIVGVEGDGQRVVEPVDGSIETLLGAHGRVPLPPYIERFAAPTAEDLERYQTVYARPPGSVAAPTAGLHFTQQMLEAIRRRGVELHELTLHVGPGTFRPIKTGTTTARALESAAGPDGRVRSLDGAAHVYITPGYTFRVVDALLTNFHLPRSSLLALVAAFAGRELIMKSYGHAVRAGYRFYSYGDATLIL